MRILVHAWGSRGDVEPALALAVGLAARGHEVAVAAARDFGEWIRGHGVGFEPIDVDLGEASRTPLGRRWLGGTASSTREEYALMRDFMRVAAGPIATTLVRTTDAYDAIVTTSVLLEAMISLGVRRGRRVACAMLQPGLASAHAESTMYAVRPGSSPLNRAVGIAATVRIRPIVGPVADVTRRLAGLPRLSWVDYVRLTLTVPFLLPSSPLVTPPADDWPMPVEVTGFWRLPVDEAWRPDERLAAFLAAGPPPVYVGFGSMSADDPAATSRLVREAVARAGVRAVVLAGTADLDLAHDPEVLVIDGAPHARLFPLMAAVVAHGGAGTTGAALTAGVPQVVVPHMGDQPYWGRRVHELRVGAAPVPRRGLTADRLAAAIRDALAPERARAAAALGERLRAEDGVARAADVLETRWSR